MKEKLVYGAGINDAGYQVSSYEGVNGKRKLIWQCPIYKGWTHMLERCYSSKLHDVRPTYRGCSVSPEWLIFSEFREWLTRQDHEDKQLDKDILIPGNKVYGPDTCVFVSRQLNSFLADRDAARGEWPIGVNWHKGKAKFQAICRNPFTLKQEFLGLFIDPNEAHEAWRARKHQHACAYADMQVDPRIAAALRIRYGNGSEQNKEAS